MSRALAPAAVARPGQTVVPRCAGTAAALTAAADALAVPPA